MGEETSHLYNRYIRLRWSGIRLVSSSLIHNLVLNVCMYDTCQVYRHNRSREEEDDVT
jgi:hypothetical protein